MCLNFERRLIAAALVLAAVGALECAFVRSVAAAEPDKYRETVLHVFGGPYDDGADPASPVIYVKGMLYGTTFSGGDMNSGTLYSVDPKTGQEAILYSFYDDTQGALIHKKGALYGTTKGDDSEGTVFTFDLKTNALSYLYAFQGGRTGDFPVAGVIDMDGTLYGTTYAGGAAGADSCDGAGCGVVYSLEPATRIETTLYSFCGQQDCADGRWPAAELIALNGVLYGTTSEGGTTGCTSTGNEGCGTAFSVDPKTRAEKILHAFCSEQDCADGALPHGGLVELNGMLYGTTYWGGSRICTQGCGTIFSIDPSSGSENVVYAFQGGADGAFPTATLIVVKGVLYGTTDVGRGTVFSFDPSTGVEKVLYSFRGGMDGAKPISRLIDVNGTLFGTTGGGGGTGCNGQGCGTVFSLER